MSELKPIKIMMSQPDAVGTIHKTPCDVYLKSEADKVIAHNKYKRCLAMATWCKCKRIDAADYRIPRRKWDFYDKWRKRWLALAEKFKEGK